jgi:hypothetical protein
MINFCPKCHSANYHPVEGCRDCGYILLLSLINPSSYQEQKFLKHGIEVTPSGIQVATASWNPFATQGASRFDASIDLANSIQYVAASASIVQPNSRFANRGDSLIWVFGQTTGGGVFGGTPQYFYGIRAVEINNPTKIHFFPDNIRPYVDYAVTCRVCRTQYPATNVPPICTCGHPLTHSAIGGS